MHSDGSKYPGQRTLYVHQAIADTVKAIFTEIFNGEEKFPIYSVCGYAWRASATSENGGGLPSTLIPTKNYMITSGGDVVAGSFWDPSKSPYSIPESGDVVDSFKKYGFSLGRERLALIARLYALFLFRHVKERI
jgi:hypothetical protein